MVEVIAIVNHKWKMEKKFSSKFPRTECVHMLFEMSISFIHFYSNVRRGTRSSSTAIKPATIKRIAKDVKQRKNWKSLGVKWYGARKKTNDKSCRKRRRQRRRRRAIEIKMSGKECKQVCGVCSFGSWNNRKSKIIVLCKWCYGDSLHIVWPESWRVPMFAAHAVRTNIITYHTMLPLNHRATSTYLSPSAVACRCKCVRCAHMTVAYIAEYPRSQMRASMGTVQRMRVEYKGKVRARNAAQKSHKFAKQSSLAFCREAFFRSPRLLSFFACVLRRALVIVNLHKKWLFFFLFGVDWSGWTKCLQRKWRRDKCEWPGPVRLCWTRSECDECECMFAYRAHRWLRERVNSTDPATTAQTTFPFRFLCIFLLFLLLRWPFTFITHTRTSTARIHNDNGIRMSF